MRYAPDALRQTGGRVFRDLRASFRGALIQPDAEAYEETRRIWNGAVDRRPALIGRCVDAEDALAMLRLPAITSCRSPYAEVDTGSLATRYPTVRS
jgi:hypothetical protein